MGAQRCPQCGEELPRGARFCAFCGVVVEQTGSHTSAREERRVITALFADLAGSTQLGERLDPEDFRDLTGGALAIMGASIEDLGGTVRGTAGDGVLGLFGAPTAHEDDAERAVIAGLRLVEAMRAYSRDAAGRWGVADLRVRVGLETGLAVLGEVRAGSQVQYDASGDCLNTAARLEGAADPGGVLVGPVTHRLVQDAFDWSQARPLRLKGKAEEVLGHHALAARGDRPVRDAARSRLVGRAVEVEVAAAIVDAVRSGSARAVVVTGQAGIGKTRFLREFRTLFEGDGGDRSTWLEGTSLSYAQDEAYLPFRQILRQVLGRSESLSEVRAAVTELVAPERVRDIAAILGMILGLAADDVESDRIAGLSSESLRHAVIDACTELITALAVRGPVAIALDDLHWADAASLRLAEGLISGFPGDACVLLVLAMRPEHERAAWSLRGETLRADPRRSVEVALTSLGQEDERGLIADLIGEGTLPSDLETTLLERAEGNPFYLRELLRSLQDAGAIVQHDGLWTFDQQVTVEVPETVERVVLARIDRLPWPDRDLLNAAAVIGREFGLSLLGQIAGDDLSPDALSNLTRLGLVEATSGVEYRFSHPLIQETAYSNMLRRGRADLHGRAAAAIERSTAGGSVEHHAALARHHRAAGHVAEAVKYHRLAGLASERIVAMAEALHQFDLALASADALEPDAARVQVPELRLRRAHVRGRVGDYAGGLDDLREALAGARAVDDEQVEMEALNDLGWLLRVHGYEEAIHHHHRALRIAERRNDPAAQVNALSRLAMIHLNRLRLDEGLDLAQRALRIARAADQDPLLGSALDCLKLAALQVGDLELLEQTMAEIIEVQERVGDVYLLQWAYIEGATVPLARGDLDQARSRIGLAREANQRFSADRIARAFILEASSWIDRAAGDVDAAVDAVRRAVDTIGETSPEFSAWLEATLGSHLIEQGHLDDAIAVLESALAHSNAIRSPNRAFRAASHLAWARQLAGDEAGSRAALVQVRSVLATISAPPGAVFLDGYRSYLAVARTCLAAGDPDAARALVEPLLAAARAQGWSSAEQDAEALLVQLPA